MTCPLRVDEDDEETREVIKTIPTWYGSDFVLDIVPLDNDERVVPVVWGGFLGWTAELVAVELKRREENGNLSE